MLAVTLSVNIKRKVIVYFMLDVDLHVTFYLNVSLKIWLYFHRYWAIRSLLFCIPASHNVCRGSITLRCFYLDFQISILPSSNYDASFVHFCKPQPPFIVMLSCRISQ